MTTDLLARRMIETALLGLLAAALFFALFPGADLAASHLFGDAAGFPIAHDPPWIALRYGFIATSDGAILALALVLIRNLLRPASPLLTNAEIGFGLLAYTLGPGLVANGIFKTFWGRARPREIVEFGGHHLFSSPLLPSHECLSNCSFVSGEGSAVTCVALIAALLLWPRCGRRGRFTVVTAATCYAGCGSILRIAFGGHFLSDIIFAALLMGVVVPAIYLGVLHVWGGRRVDAATTARQRRRPRPLPAAR